MQTCLEGAVLGMVSATVDKATLDRVRANFVAKRDIIFAHKKPWTPWALAHLLGIDDKHTAEPAEFILYKALRASAPNRIGFADPKLKVNHD